MSVPEESHSFYPRPYILDRTGQNLGDLKSEEIDLGPDLIEVHYTNTRLRELPCFSRLENLEVLILRQNILDAPQLSELSILTTLRHLDLYGNILTVSDINIDKCTLLTTLDFSFNKIKRMEGFSTLVNLRNLHFANNKIRKITEGISCLTALESLELGFNRVRNIDNLSLNKYLKHLWLGKNKIEEIKNLETLTNLRRLDIQTNRLTQIKGLETLIMLEELYLSHNGIRKIECLENLTRLQILDLSNNWITHIENLQNLTDLEDFWFSSNHVEDFREILHLTQLPKLTTVYLEGNPFASDVAYRNKVLLTLTSLEQLDAVPVHGPTYRFTFSKPSTNEPLKASLKSTGNEG